MKYIYIILIIAVLFCVPYLVASGYSEAASSVADIVTLPEINSFKVSPTSIDSESISVLSWDVRNAYSVSIDHGIGDVSASGQVDVKPLYSTTYKLTVSNDAGIRTRYVTLYVENARAYTSDKVNCDPVTGRNAEIDMAWESYCLSDEYQVQIARDPAFTLLMYDSGSMGTADSLLPAFWSPPGALEAGHTYYWRVRTTRVATGQRILSYWSDVKSFTVSPGFPVSADYLEVHAFTPANGCTACPVKPVSFSWSGYPDTSQYRFILARDSQLQNIVVEAITPTTSYQYSGSLDYDTGYFWQVMAIEPIPSDPSALFTFHTESAPLPEKAPATGIPSEIPPWALTVIVTGAVLIGIVIFLAVKSRQHI